MSKSITLASGQITQSADQTITVELLEPVGEPAIVRVTWPAQATVTTPPNTPRPRPWRCGFSPTPQPSSPGSKRAGGDELTRPTSGTLGRWPGGTWPRWGRAAYRSPRRDLVPHSKSDACPALELATVPRTVEL